VHGAGETAWKEATLQDYWRWTPLPDGGWREESDETLLDLGLLVQKNGALWHALHCPEMTAIPVTDGNQRHPAPLDGAGHGADVQSAGAPPPAGTGSGAASGGPLAEAILERLAAAKEFRDRHADERALLRGARCTGIDAVFQRFQSDDKPPTIHLTMTLSGFEALDVSERRFGQMTSFSGCLFSGAAQFSSAEFGGEAQFNFAKFGGEAQFSSAEFGGVAQFGSASFGGVAQFHFAKFGGVAQFASAKFGGVAQFGSASFGDEAQFNSAMFGGVAQFGSASFGGEAQFHFASFGGEAQFHFAKFGSVAWFDSASFGDQAQFDSVEFGGVAQFSSAMFGDNAQFSSASFGGVAQFGSAMFGGEAQFSSAEFGGVAQFNSAEFGGVAQFGSAKFRDFADWELSEFRGTTSFAGAQWDADTHYGRSFKGARFRDVADFETTNFSAFAAFDEATFEKRLILSEPSGGKNPDDLFTSARLSVERATVTDCEASAEDKDDTRPAVTVKFDVENQRWSELAGGYRVAKKAMEAQGDFEREQRYYRFEVQARLKRPSTTIAERVAAGFYGWFSDFGASIGRPFAGLGAFIAAFALIYLGLAVAFGDATISGPHDLYFDKGFPYVHTTPVADTTWQALEFSLTNAFRPLYALATKAPENLAGARLAEQLLFAESGALRNFVRILIIFQSLLSVILAFLFGLAVRRKFQIS